MEDCLRVFENKCFFKVSSAPLLIKYAQLQKRAIASAPKLVLVSTAAMVCVSRFSLCGIGYMLLGRHDGLFDG